VARNTIPDSVVAKEFDDFLIISLSKKWIQLNENKPLEFDVIISEEGKLVLSSRLARLDKTREVIDIAM
jgi:hypothetical protein